MVAVANEMQLPIAKSDSARYVSPERGDRPVADDAVLEILQRIQSSIAALDAKTQASIAALDAKTQSSIDALDRKVTRQHAMVTQDIRMIRAAIHDMGETRVTEGEIEALHEDVNRVQARLEDLVTRIETLEGHRE